MIGKYITVRNKQTKKDVPFSILPNGEIKIISKNPADNEDTCIVVLGDIFFENSQDFLEHYDRM